MLGKCRSGDGGLSGQVRDLDFQIAARQSTPDLATTCPRGAIDEKKVGPEVAFHEATPVIATLSEAMFAEGRWEFLAGNQRVEDVLQRFDVEFGVFTSVPVIALEAREND